MKYWCLFIEYEDRYEAFSKKDLLEARIQELVNNEGYDLGTIEVGEVEFIKVKIGSLIYTSA